MTLWGRSEGASATAFLRMVFKTKGCPNTILFFSAQWFLGKIKIPNSTKVDVHSRKKEKWQHKFSSDSVTNGPAGLQPRSLRDSASYTTGSQPLHSHQMPAVSMAHGNFPGVKKLERDRLKRE